jgi:predicted nucleic acid-binding protein
LHTDTLVDLLRGQSETVAYLRNLTPAQCAISVVSIGDLAHAVEQSRSPAESERRVRLLLRDVTVLPVDSSIAWTYGRLRTHIALSDNRVIDDLDLIMAATAIVHDLTLLTRNERWFELVPGLRWSATIAA